MTFTRSSAFRFAHIALAVAAFAVCAVAQSNTFRVVGVSDGDTITVLDKNKRQTRVRLAGIDAPETGQDFGNRAKQMLSSLIFGKNVQLIGDKTDRYGRRVAKVMIDGTDANLEMIKAGLAWHYKQYAKEQSIADREMYKTAEARARAGQLRLWSMPLPLAPWDYRAGRATPEQAAAQMPELVLASGTSAIIGNRNSRIYHWPGCKSYFKVAERNRVLFLSRADAEKAGYRAARNCSE